MSHMVLVVVLALLGHGLLMADDARAYGPKDPHGSHAGMSSEMSHAGDASTLTLTPAHPDACGTAMPAVTPQAQVKSGPGAHVHGILSLGHSEPVQMSEPAHPPTCPPDARRALFQVYRI
jgi:hypothetical protein